MMHTISTNFNHNKPKNNGKIQTKMVEIIELIFTVIIYFNKLNWFQPSNMTQVSDFCKWNMLKSVENRVKYVEITLKCWYIVKMSQNICSQEFGRHDLNHFFMFFLTDFNAIRRILYILTIWAPKLVDMSKTCLN